MNHNDLTDIIARMNALLRTKRDTPDLLRALDETERALKVLREYVKAGRMADARDAAGVLVDSLMRMFQL